MSTKIRTPEPEPKRSHRKKSPSTKRGMPTPEQVARRKNYEPRFFTEKKDVTFKATCRVIDSQRQRPNLYMADPAAATRVAIDLNHFYEFIAALKTTEALRDIISNMVAMESVADMDELTKVCDRNRHLLRRIEAGPFAPTAKQLREREDAEFEKNALNPKDPADSHRAQDED
jgi:hypothetical protein